MLKKIKVSKDTFLKQSTDQSKDLPDEQKVLIKAGQELRVLAERPVDKDHKVLTFDTAIEGRNTWYAYAPHFEEPIDKGILIIVMSPANARDQYGGEIFNWKMTMGDETLELQMGSGVPGRRPVPVGQDWPGSGNPIPQGTYEIGATVRESLSEMDPRIGPVWIPLKPLTRIGGRDGFLIHMDYNWQYSPGTLGCPFPLRNRDMDTIAAWNDRAAKGTLQVNHGF